MSQWHCKPTFALYVADDLYFGKTNQYHVIILGGLQQYFVKAEECIHFCIVAFSLEVNKGEIILTGLFNNQAYHSPALTLAILDNILFMLISGPNASLTVSNKPQLPSADKKERERYVVLLLEFYTLNAFIQLWLYLYD